MKPTIINTLGPKETDSFVSANYWSQNFCPGSKIILYESFENLFSNLHKDELIVMPTGYCNRNNCNLSSWVDFHFKYIEKLEVIDSYVLETKSMVVLKNKNYQIDKAVIQSATYQLLKQKLEKDIEIDYVSSKAAAYDIFISNKYHYTLCSKTTYNMGTKKDIEIVSEFSPKMIWVVYKCIE